MLPYEPTELYYVHKNVSVRLFSQHPRIFWLKLITTLKSVISYSRWCNHTDGTLAIFRLPLIIFFMKVI